MKNYQVNSFLKEFDGSRQQWIDILVNNPGNSDAAYHIISINSKMELIRAFWNWNDETVEMAVVR